MSAQATTARGRALFLFPDSFEDHRPAATPPAPPLPPPEPVFTAAALAEARAEGFAAGSAAARDEAEAAQRAIVADLLATIAQRLGETRTALSQTADAQAAAIARLLFAALAAAFPTLRERFGEAEIVRVAAAVVPALLGRADVVIRAHPSHQAAIEAAIARMPVHAGPAPRIEASAGVAIGDIGIFWQDGRVVRDGDAIWSRINAILQDIEAE